MMPRMATPESSPSQAPSPVLDYESPKAAGDARWIVRWLSIAAIIYGIQQVASFLAPYRFDVAWVLWINVQQIISSDLIEAGYRGSRMAVPTASLVLIASAIGCLARRDLRPHARIAAYFIIAGTLGSTICEHWITPRTYGRVLSFPATPTTPMEDLAGAASKVTRHLVGLALPMLIVVLFRRRSPDSSPSQVPTRVLDCELSNSADFPRIVKWLSIAAIIYGIPDVPSFLLFFLHLAELGFWAYFTFNSATKVVLGSQAAAHIGNLLLIASAIGCLTRRNLRPHARIAAFFIIAGTLGSTIRHVMYWIELSRPSGYFPTRSILDDLTYLAREVTGPFVGLALPMLIVVLFRPRTPDDPAPAFTRRAH